MAGRKRVEFRRARFAKPVSHVIVYATSPVKRVLGYFQVDHITEAEPSALWRQFSEVGEIEIDAFSRYYEGVSDGVAIGVGEVVKLGEPMELHVLLPEAVAPQSYRYADSQTIHELCRRARSHSEMSPVIA